MRSAPTFLISLVGYGLAVTGVGVGASAAGLSSPWIVAIVLILAGLGVIGALTRTGQTARSP